MDTRNKLLIAAILFAAFLPPISLAQDTVSVDEMMRRYELYQQGLLKDDSLNADEVVYTSYGKRRYNGRANWKGLPYTYMLVNNLRTPEYPDKEHFWSFVVIRQKLLLGRYQDSERGIGVPQSMEESRAEESDASSKAGHHLYWHWTA